MFKYMAFLPPTLGKPCPPSQHKNTGVRMAERLLLGSGSRRKRMCSEGVRVSRLSGEPGNRMSPCASLTMKLSALLPDLSVPPVCRLPSLSHPATLGVVTLRITGSLVAPEQVHTASLQRLGRC